MASISEIKPAPFRLRQTSRDQIFSNQAVCSRDPGELNSINNALAPCPLRVSDVRR
jgi:hypothetical protein